MTALQQGIETTIGAYSLLCAGISFFLLFIIGFKNKTSVFSLSLILMTAMSGVLFSALQQAQAAIPYSDIASNPEQAEKITNHRIVDANDNVVKILQTKNGILINQDTPDGYIFVGRFQHGLWRESLFEHANGLLSFGDELVLTKRRGVYQCAPYRKKTLDLKYTFCDQVGSSAKNSRVRISRSPLIVGVDNVWVYIEAMSKKQDEKEVMLTLAE